MSKINSFTCDTNKVYLSNLDNDEYKKIVKNMCEMEKEIIERLKSNKDVNVDNLSKTLYELSPNKVFDKVEQYFYCGEFMESVENIINAIVSPASIDEDVKQVNKRIRQYFKGLKQIGANSVAGFALSTSLYNDTDEVNKEIDNLLVLKAPKPGTSSSELLHELIVAKLGTNKLRHLIPNFAQVFNSFRCSAPVIEEDRTVSSFCTNDKSNEVNYVIYENVLDSISFSKFCSDQSKCDEHTFMMYYIQILLALGVAREKCGFTHYDLHGDNVLMREYMMDSKEFALKYEISKEEYNIKSYGYIPTIIDYGRSTIITNDGAFGFFDTSFVNYGTIANKSNIMYDAFKLLCFSMRDMLSYNGTNYYMDENDNFLETKEIWKQDENNDVIKLYSIEGEPMQCNFNGHPTFLNTLTYINRQCDSYFLLDKHGQCILSVDGVPISICKDGYLYTDQCNDKLSEKMKIVTYEQVLTYGSPMYKGIPVNDKVRLDISRQRDGFFKPGKNGNYTLHENGTGDGNYGKVYLTYNDGTPETVNKNGKPLSYMDDCSPITFNAKGVVTSNGDVINTVFDALETKNVFRFKTFPTFFKLEKVDKRRLYYNDKIFYERNKDELGNSYKLKTHKIENNFYITNNGKPIIVNDNNEKIYFDSDGFIIGDNSINLLDDNFKIVDVKWALKYNNEQVNIKEWEYKITTVEDDIKNQLNIECYKKIRGLSEFFLNHNNEKIYEFLCRQYYLRFAYINLSENYNDFECLKDFIDYNINYCLDNEIISPMITNDDDLISLSSDLSPRVDMSELGFDDSDQILKIVTDLERTKDIGQYLLKITTEQILSFITSCNNIHPVEIFRPNFIDGSVSSTLTSECKSFIVPFITDVLQYSNDVNRMMKIYKYTTEIRKYCLRANNKLIFTNDIVEKLKRLKFNIESEKDKVIEIKNVLNADTVSMLTFKNIFKYNVDRYKIKLLQAQETFDIDKTELNSEDLAVAESNYQIMRNDYKIYFEAYINLRHIFNKLFEEISIV
jgi:hypothetical protein